MAAPTILVVDDEELLRWSLRERLSEAGYPVLEAATGADAERHAADGDAIDLVLLDVKLPDADGLELLRRLRQTLPDAPVLLMTAYSTVDNAVEAIRDGAYHYIRKPFEMDQLLLHVEQALETTRLRREVQELRARACAPHAPEAFVGRSRAMEDLRELLVKVAATPASTVLLTGESGTGKDLAAKVIHFNAERGTRPFMHITCSAVPESLLESELFGHERGAFTDARQRRAGLLELAEGGTVFLDEVGEMTPALQAKLLRFLEEKTFKRVGGAADVRVDVRVVAATNRDLLAEVRTGRFRQDLYYRLGVLPVHLPALRDHAADVPDLARHFLARFRSEFRRGPRDLAPEALDRLAAHGWPGNVRELRNTIERAVLLVEGDVIGPGDLPRLSPAEAASPLRLPPEGVQLEALERELVVQALERTGGNLTRAGALLGLTRDQVRYRLQKFGIGEARGSD